MVDRVNGRQIKWSTDDMVDSFECRQKQLVKFKLPDHKMMIKYFEDFSDLLFSVKVKAKKEYKPTNKSFRK